MTRLHTFSSLTFFSGHGTYLGISQVCQLLLEARADAAPQSTVWTFLRGSKHLQQTNMVPSVNDHIAIAGMTSPIFNRKIIDETLRGVYHFPATAMLARLPGFFLECTAPFEWCLFLSGRVKDIPPESSIPKDPLLQKDAVRMGLNVMSQGC